MIGTALETALENAYIQLSNTLAPGQAEKIEALLVIATPSEGDDANGCVATLQSSRKSG